MDLRPEDLRLLKSSEIEWLKALAAERGISFEAYIELLVRKYVEKNYTGSEKEPLPPYARKESGPSRSRFALLGRLPQG